MNYLYILFEDKNDEMFYHLCLEKLTGQTFNLSQKLYFAEGMAGVASVRSGLNRLLSDIQYMGTLENVFFLAAIDNDRSPCHPEHVRLPNLGKNDRRKECRFCEILTKIEEKFGQDWTKWPIRGAVVVPVEMLESWLLLICGVKENESDLPLFAKKRSPSAIDYYKKPSNQLKDLCRIQQRKLGLTKDEFYLHCVEQLNPDQLTQSSSSFALFKQQVDHWFI